MSQRQVAFPEMGLIKAEHREINLDYLAFRLFYCTDHMPPDVVELLDRFDIDIEKYCAIYGYTYAAAAHSIAKKLLDASTS